MALKTRSFEPVQYDLVNIETGKARYTTHDIYRPPPIAFWRLNLTALSQKYNLYFIANGGFIHVFNPEFPYQTLGGAPALILIPDLKNPEAEGFINPHEPHNVNHLIVGDLGNQEILLFSTDSGNVVAYHTHSINTAINRFAQMSFANATASSSTLRPFFSQWVVESAWGLAVHTEARMIAVSANKPHDLDEDYGATATITVFAFALTASVDSAEDSKSDVGQEPRPLDDHTEWKLWSSATARDYLDTPTRDCNYKIVLAGDDGHKHNIPSITFINNPEDTAGSWLLSSDMTGRMKMWQIWQGRCQKTWTVTTQPEAATPWTFNPEAGWNVVAIDINAFRPAESNNKFMGHHIARQYFGYRSKGVSYDLTDVVLRYTPRNSNFHPTITYHDGDTSEDEEDELDEVMSDIEPDVFDQRTTSLNDAVVEESPDGAELNDTRSPSSETDAEVLDNVMYLELGDDDYEETDEELSITSDNALESATEVEVTEDMSDENDGSPEINEDYLSPNSGKSSSSHSSYNPRSGDEYEDAPHGETHVDSHSAVSSSSTDRRMREKLSASTTIRQQPEVRSRIPSTPIIYCSTSQVRLFSSPSATDAHIYCGRILRQHLPTAMERSNFAFLDRLSIVQQIPELGIIVIATQIGRCAICSLTKRTSDGLLGFRVDWILPTKKQEREGVRPTQEALLGIAVSPIQGQIIKKHQPVSEYDHGHRWTKDRTINGTPTSFDPNIVVLDANRIPETSTIPPNQRPAVTEKRDWTKPTHNEKWRPFEVSRRYRLMLTYSNFTVLTYELSRGIEKEDISH